MRPLARLLYRLEIEGRVPPGPCIVAANHESMLDPPLLALTASQPLHFLAKVELWRHRPGAWLMDALGGIPIRRDRRDLVSLGLWLFFVENALFPNQHQEYGVLGIRAYDAGRPTAEPQLLDFAAAQGASPYEFGLPVPSWVHPAWLLFTAFVGLNVLQSSFTNVCPLERMLGWAGWLGCERARHVDER